MTTFSVQKERENLYSQTIVVYISARTLEVIDSVPFLLTNRKM